MKSDNPIHQQTQTKKTPQNKKQNPNEMSVSKSDWEKKVEEEQVKFAIALHIFGTTEKAEKATIQIKHLTTVCPFYF